MNRKSAMALLAAALGASVLGAQEGPLPMEQIVVTATRTATTVLDSPDHVTVISAAEIEASGAVSVADVLEQAAGVEISDNGTLGSVQSVRIRGSTSAQVLVLVDGVRLNDSRQGGADLSQLELNDIERIEVLRGGTSALYGADALGGVVNIITKSKAERTLTLRLQNGSYLPHAGVQVLEGSGTQPVAADPLDLVDTQKVGLELFRALGPVEFLATGSFTRAANGFMWLDRTYVDDYRRRVNGGLLEGAGSLSLEAPVGGGKAGFKAQYDYSSEGVAGGISTDPFVLSTDASQQRSALQSQLFFVTPKLASSALSLEARAFYKFTRLDYQEPTPTFGLPVDDTHRLHTVGLDLVQRFSVFEWLGLVYGGNLVYDLAQSTTIGRRDRLSGGAFLELPLYLLPRLTITPMARYDLYSDFPGDLTYKLALVYNLSDSVSLKASGGKSYRAPTLNDLYWPNDGFAAGNPKLRPETGYSADLGLTVAARNLELNLFGFARYVLDGIQWAETAPFFYQPVNIGEALYPGAEADLSLTLFRHLRLSAAYTFLYSFVLQGSGASYGFADDKRAPYSPVHTASGAVELTTGGTLVRVDAQYVGPRFSDEANTKELGWYLVLNAEVRQKISPSLTLALAGKNLLNQVYQTVSGYVMPPLSFWLGAELSL